MKPLFQLSTRNYESEIPLVRKAMIDLENRCKTKNGYKIGEPFKMAGWTFFDLELSLEMMSVIETTGMMEGALGYGITEQLKNFIGHYLESQGSQARIKQINYE